MNHLHLLRDQLTLSVGLQTLSPMTGAQDSRMCPVQKFKCKSLLPGLQAMYELKSPGESKQP